jgi:hypothetical protein
MQFAFSDVLLYILKCYIYVYPLSSLRQLQKCLDHHHIKIYKSSLSTAAYFDFTNLQTSRECHPYHQLQKVNSKGKKARSIVLFDLLLWLWTVLRNTRYDYCCAFKCCCRLRKHLHTNSQWRDRSFI